MKIRPTMFTDILDTEKLEARLPQEKVDRICEFIQIILHKSSCTKRELLQLLGHMNFATHVIIPGRSFVSYLVLNIFYSQK